MIRKIILMAGLLFCLGCLASWSNLMETDAPNSLKIRPVRAPVLYNQCYNAITSDEVSDSYLSLSCEGAYTGLTINPTTPFICPQFKDMQSDTILTLNVDLKKAGKSERPDFVPYSMQFKVIPAPQPEIEVVSDGETVDPIQLYSSKSKIAYTIAATPAFVLNTHHPTPNRGSVDARYMIKALEVWKQTNGEKFERVDYPVELSKPGSSTGVEIDLSKIDGLIPGKSRVALRATEIVRINYRGDQIPVNLPIHQRTVVLEIGS